METVTIITFVAAAVIIIFCAAVIIVLVRWKQEAEYNSRKVREMAKDIGDLREMMDRGGGPAAGPEPLGPDIVRAGMPAGDAADVPPPQAPGYAGAAADETGRRSPLSRRETVHPAPAVPMRDTVPGEAGQDIYMDGGLAGLEYESGMNEIELDDVEKLLEGLEDSRPEPPGREQGLPAGEGPGPGQGAGAEYYGAPEEVYRGAAGGPSGSAPAGWSRRAPEPGGEAHRDVRGDYDVGRSGRTYTADELETLIRE